METICKNCSWWRRDNTDPDKKKGSCVFRSVGMADNSCSNFNKGLNYGRKNIIITKSKS